MKWHGLPSEDRRAWVWPTLVPRPPRCRGVRGWRPSQLPPTTPPPPPAGSHLSTLWVPVCQISLCLDPLTQVLPKTPATQPTLVPCPLVEGPPVYPHMTTPQNQVHQVRIELERKLLDHKICSSCISHYTVGFLFYLPLTQVHRFKCWT